MAFENISKGNFIRSGWNVREKVRSIHEPSKIICCVESNRFDAEFISYCFNIQQRYDISKLEEAVDLLSKIAVKLLYGFDIKQDSDIHKQIEQLLKQIKK